MRSITSVVLSGCLIGTMSLSTKGSTAEVKGSRALDLHRLNGMPYSDAEKKLITLEPKNIISNAPRLFTSKIKNKDIENAKKYLNLALATAHENKLIIEEVTVRHLYASLYSYRYKLDKASVEINSALKLFRLNDIKEHPLLLKCLMFKANLDHRRGDYTESLKAYKMLLLLLNDATDELDRAGALQQISMLYCKMHHAEKGEGALKEALDIFEKLGNSKGTATCLKTQGNNISSKGDHIGAMNLYKLAIEKYRLTGDVHGEANCYYNLGLQYQITKQFDKAIDSLQDAIVGFTKSSSVGGVGIANMHMGYTFYLSGHYDKAETHLLSSLKLLKSGGNIIRIAQAEEYLGKLMEAQGDSSKALSYRQAAISHYEKVKNKVDADRVRKLIKTKL